MTRGNRRTASEVDRDRQRLVRLLYVRWCTQDHMARYLGVSVRTVRRWLSDVPTVERRGADGREYRLDEDIGARGAT